MRSRSDDEVEVRKLLCHSFVGFGSHGRHDKDGTLAVTNSDFKCYGRASSSNGATLLIWPGMFRVQAA